MFKIKEKNCIHCGKPIRDVVALQTSFILKCGECYKQKAASKIKDFWIG